MSKSSRPSAQKRAKEKARQEKQQQKQARRLQSKQLKANSGPRAEEEDPDIAGICIGPQPVQPGWDTVTTHDKENK
jgi:hypothetical protein